MKRCPICAELIDEKSTVCPFCGEQLQAAPPPPAPPSTVADVKPSQKSCPICGEMIDAHLTVCPICGEYIGAPQPVVEPQPEPVVLPEPELEVATRPTPVVVPPPIPEPQPEPVVMPEPEPVVATRPTPVVVPEPEVMPEPVVMPEPEPVVTPNPEPVAASQPEPVVTPTPKPEPQPEPVTEFGPAPTPEPEVKSAGTPIPPINPTPRNSYQDESPRKNNWLKYILGLLALLLIAAIGVLCYLLFFKGDKSNDPNKEDAKQETVAPSSAARVMSTEEILDSVANELSDEVGLVAIYPDEDRACLYYIFNGELYKYSASNNETETLTIPVDEETDAVMNAEKEEDDTYLRIDMGDNNMKHTASYRLNTQTGSLIRVKENTAPAVTNQESAPEPYSNKRQRPDDMPPPPPDGRGPGSRGYREPRTIDGQRPDRPHRGWRDENRQAPQRNEEVAPPNSNSSGFHFEPSNGQSGNRNQSGNNSGIHFQKVDRIPNQ